MTRLSSARSRSINLTEQSDAGALTSTIAVAFTDLDLSDVGHSASITHAVASGATNGLALNEAALIALIKPEDVTKAAGSTSGSVELSFSAASTAFDYLAQGQVLTLKYTVAIDDGDGGVTSRDFVITVTGPTTRRRSWAKSIRRRKPSSWPLRPRSMCSTRA